MSSKKKLDDDAWLHYHYTWNVWFCFWSFFCSKETTQRLTVRLVCRCHFVCLSLRRLCHSIVELGCCFACDTYAHHLIYLSNRHSQIVYQRLIVLFWQQQQQQQQHMSSTSSQYIIMMMLVARLLFIHVVVVAFFSIVKKMPIGQSYIFTKNLIEGCWRDLLFVFIFAHKI